MNHRFNVAALVAGGVLASFGATTAGAVQPAENGPASKPTPGHVCIISVDAGPDDCSMTASEVNSKAEAALAKGELPPGFAKLPPKQAGAGAARSRKDGKARRLLHYNYAELFYDIGFSGTWGYLGYTGNDYWRNLSSTWNNKASSGAGMDAPYNTYFHDQADGHGYYYTGLTAYTERRDFRNQKWQGTSRSINDELTSWKLY
jgi:hypothetical protein